MACLQKYHLTMRTRTNSAAGVPKALLGHRVAKEKLRPHLPLLMPREYKALMIKCWSHQPENRCVCVCVSTNVGCGLGDAFLGAHEHVLEQPFGGQRPFQLEWGLLLAGLHAVVR